MTTLASTSRTAWSARGWAIYLGWAVVALDGSALNLALPTIAVQLQAPSGGISWVVDAYALPLASLLLLGGSLGDRFGAERIFRTGSIGFAAASIACALSPTFTALVAFRAAQGVFAAMLVPMILSLVGKSFADPRQQSTAVNLLTIIGGVGLGLGPFLGGLMTDTLGWRAVFWLTVPIAAGATFLVGRADRSAMRACAARFDWPGQLSGTAGLIAVVAGLIDLGHAAEPIRGYLLLAGGFVLLALFVAIEHRTRAPMMPLSTFRVPGFAGAVTGGFLYQFAAYGLQFFLALYLQATWGVSALVGGILLASYAIGMIAVSATANPWLLKLGTRTMTIIGTLTASLGIVILFATTEPDSWRLLIAAQFLIGIGTGIYSTALNKTATSSLGADTAGLASGVYNTARQIGGAVGIAILGALAANTSTHVGYITTMIIVLGATALIGATALHARAEV